MYTYTYICMYNTFLFDLIELREDVQGHLHVPVRPRPANKLPPKFLDQYMYKFSFEKLHKR